MRAMIHQSYLRPRLEAATLLILTLGLAFAGSAWAGPYLHRAVDYSNANSQAECVSLAGSAMARLASGGDLKVEPKNPRLGWTKDTTLFVDCLFVGRTEQRPNQWIYYVSTASTNLEESNRLRALVLDRLSKITRID